ncbi:MAG: hypothetical protein RLZZ383_537 [Pseudomonadota bacterium]
MRTVPVLAVATALSLIGAYITWTAPEETTRATDVVVVAGTEASVRSVVWKDELGTVRVARKEEGGAPYYVVDVDEVAPTPVVPPATPEGTPPAAPPAGPSHTTFLGNETASELWAGLGPLRALRALDGASAEELAAFGLDAPKATLTLDVGGTEHVLQIGGEVYGTKDRYASYEGRVWLLDDKLVRGVQYAKSRMAERRLVPFEEKAITRLEVVAPQGKRSFVHVHAADAATAYYADATTPTTKSVEATTWIGKLLRVKSKAYVEPGSIPADAVTVMKVAAAGETGGGDAEILRVGEGTTATWYARGSLFHGMAVELVRTLTEEPTADLPALFDGEEPAEAAEAPATTDGVTAAPVAPGSDASGTPPGPAASGTPPGPAAGSPATPTPATP